MLVAPSLVISLVLAPPEPVPDSGDELPPIELDAGAERESVPERPPPSEATEEAPGDTPHEDAEPAQPRTFDELEAYDETQEDDLEGLDEPDRFTPNGYPCEDPGADVPRMLTTLDGWAPCEESRYPSRSGEVLFYPGLQLRQELDFRGPFTLDNEGTSARDSFGMYGRFRLRPRLEWDGGKVVASIDAVSGRWNGSADPVLDQILVEGRPPEVPQQSDQRFPPMNENQRLVDVRELYVELTFARAGLLRVGQQSFAWGQGLLSNDGNNVGRYGDLRFGKDGPGSLNERVLFATKPFSPLGGKGKDIIVGIGGDLVYRDDNADLLAGDLALQGFILAMYRPDAKPGNWIGGYAVYRNQTFADDGDPYEDDNELKIGAVDIAGQGWRKLVGDYGVMGGFEGVVVFGTTNVPATEIGEDFEVLQGGVAAKGYVGTRVWQMGFDGGFASGDNDPGDGQINNFTANRGYTTGLLLFPYVRGWQTARSQLLAESDELSAVDPQGSQRLPTRGAVTNAVHLHPKARWNYRELIEIWGGPLLAWSPRDIVDPYASRIGGANTNSNGGPGDNHFYGTELDLGFRIRQNVSGMWAQLGIQGGVLFPGAGFADADGDTDTAIWGVSTRLELRY